MDAFDSLIVTFLQTLSYFRQEQRSDKLAEYNVDAFMEHVQRLLSGYGKRAGENIEMLILSLICITAQPVIRGAAFVPVVRFRHAVFTTWQCPRAHAAAVSHVIETNMDSKHCEALWCKLRCCSACAG